MLPSETHFTLRTYPNIMMIFTCVLCCFYFFKCSYLLEDEQTVCKENSNVQSLQHTSFNKLRSTNIRKPMSSDSMK